jgi:hypothetical protein
VVKKMRIIRSVVLALIASIALAGGSADTAYANGTAASAPDLVPDASAADPGDPGLPPDPD